MQRIVGPSEWSWRGRKDFHWACSGLIRGYAAGTTSIERHAELAVAGGSSELVGLLAGKLA